jgi:hypothetical protein
MTSAEFDEMLAIVRASQEYRAELEGLVFGRKNDLILSNSRIFYDHEGTEPVRPVGFRASFMIGYGPRKNITLSSESTRSSNSRIKQRNRFREQTPLPKE